MNDEIRQTIIAALAELRHTATGYNDVDDVAKIDRALAAMQQPQPAVTIPPTVREAIETLLSWREHGRAYEIVREWLDQEPTP